MAEEIHLRWMKSLRVEIPLHGDNNRCESNHHSSERDFNVHTFCPFMEETGKFRK